MTVDRDGPTQVPRDSSHIRRDLLKPKNDRRREARGSSTDATGGLSAPDQALFDALRKRRSDLARAQGVPAYVVFPDRSLLDMARRKPTTAAEMAGIHGVGEAKLTRYGEAFLEVIRGHRGG